MLLKKAVLVPNSLQRTTCCVTHEDEVAELVEVCSMPRGHARQFRRGVALLQSPREQLLDSAVEGNASRQAGDATAAYTVGGGID